MKEITIKSKIRNYKIRFTRNFNFLNSLVHPAPHILIVDKNVYDLYHRQILKNFRKRNILVIKAIENNKTLSKVAQIYRHLINRAGKRNTVIVSLGGGIIQDITGFVASTLYRGMNWIFIPTTLLAQTDSCIGSKTSLNFESYKNLIGTFYPPSQIYICIDFLKTLKKIDFYSGMGEVIKLQLMEQKYPKNFRKIAELIERSKNNKSDLAKLIIHNLRVKYSYFEDDEFDLGKRNLLNYGHCFGHALESASGYYIPHGTAVLIGIIFANIISLRRGWLNKDVFDYLNRNLLIPNIQLPLKRRHFQYDILKQGIKKDKKRIDKKLALILPDSKFKMRKITNVKESEFKQGFKYLNKILFQRERSRYE